MSLELIAPNGKRSLEILQRKKINKNNRIEIALQWKREEPALPHNETPALNQYQSQKKMPEKARLCPPLSQANSGKYITWACTPVKFQRSQNIPWDHQLYALSWRSKYQQT